MKLIHASNYYPPPPTSLQPPVRVEINFDPEPDRSYPIPQWSYSFEIQIHGDIVQGGGGTVEALDDDQAVIRVYSRVIDALAERLAARVERPALRPAFEELHRAVASATTHLENYPSTARNLNDAFEAARKVAAEASR